GRRPAPQSARQDQPPRRTRPGAVRVRITRRPLSHFAETLKELQSTCAPERLTVSPHTAISRVMNLPVSAGPIDTVSAPSAASLSWISGRLSTSRVAALSLSTTALGVPAGAIKTIHACASYPGTPSAETGFTSGNARAGSLPPTANTLNAPDCTCGMMAGPASNINATSPLSSPVNAAEAPRYGTCVIVSPAWLLNISIAK